jgi:hypothetical protein
MNMDMITMLIGDKNTWKRQNNFYIFFRVSWHHFSLRGSKQFAMKKILFASLLVAFSVSVNNLSAQEYKTALGVRLSSAAPMVNNSISLKQFINSKVAIEGLFSFGDPLALGAMVEFHKPLSSAGLSYFYGGGGYIGFVKNTNPTTQKASTDPNFGAQGVVGLDYKFSNIPLNLSLDWKPELNIVSDINFEPAAIGFTARFTLGK